MTELGEKVWKKMEEELGWENPPEGFHLEYFEDIIECTKKILTTSNIRNNKIINARKIIIKTLKMYNLTEVEEMNYHADLAKDIINDLVNAGFLK